MEIVWMPVRGFEDDYIVSNTGIVKSIDRDVYHGYSGTIHIPEKEVKQFDHNRGYKIVRLYHRCKCRQTTVHRTVMEAFSSPLQTGLSVNHINGIKTDNRLENLEWMTYFENTRHAVRNNLIKGRGVVCVETGKVYECLCDVARDIDAKIPSVVFACKNKTRTIKGFHYRYADEEPA